MLQELLCTQFQRYNEISFMLFPKKFENEAFKK